MSLGILFVIRPAKTNEAMRGNWQGVGHHKYKDIITCCPHKRSPPLLTLKKNKIFKPSASF